MNTCNLPAMPADPWEEFRTRLRDALTALPVNGDLCVSEPDPPVPSGPPRRWWQRGSAKQRSGRYVQFIKWPEEMLSGECVSGAYADVSDEQHRQVVSLGWSDPQTHPASFNTENFTYSVPTAELDRLVDQSVAALQILGDKAPDDSWTWHVNER